MDDVISAGDVGRFAFCPLNWKRSLAGDRGAGGEAGVRAHEALREEVDALEEFQGQARFTLESAFYLALLAISAAAIAIEIFLLDRGGTAWWILLLLSVMWAAGMLYMLVFNRYYDGRAQQVVRRTKIQAGEIVFSDSARHKDVLESRILPLRGRPDYVVERDGHRVPVEFKTGRTPRQPFTSHVLQLAAYCYLVGERHGRPPYGILAYPDRQFEIPYTQELEDRLVRTLLRIQLSQRTGEAHRDHEEPRRCAGCSRREGCPERLDVVAPEAVSVAATASK